MATWDHSGNAGEGYVYFVLAREVNRVKIGFTAAFPEKRLDGLETACPVELVRLGFIRGDSRLERDLHLDFITDWVRGEWYTYSPDLRDYIVENAEPWPASKPLGPTGAFKAWPRRYPVPVEDIAEVLAHTVCRRGGYSCAGGREGGLFGRGLACRKPPARRIAKRHWCKHHADLIAQYQQFFESGQPFSPPRGPTL